MPREPRSDSLYLADIVIASRTVARWLDQRGAEWDSDDILRNAVLRQLLVVGEASSNLSAEVRDKLPEIPWQHIRGVPQPCGPRLLQHRLGDRARGRRCEYP
ncbi:HepT-like ribonuclease domain-containing protein [Nocardia cyriacigeorgica]|uniref:HepT-like ribonuclease domain-containing protein n=1 Tax=Nocardia cyriacigeorgica TaxID=135487 RepID=UPI003D810CAC